MHTIPRYLSFVVLYLSSLSASAIEVMDADIVEPIQGQQSQPINTTTSTSELLGALEGEIQVNQGQPTWSLPIELPSGANNLSPDVNIIYSPANSNGTLGIGFNLGGQSAITRCPASKEYDGVDEGLSLTDKDKYCLDGQRLLIADDGSYHTAIESFTRVKPLIGFSSWEARTKDGFIVEYGANTSSKIKNAYSDQLLSWRISSKRDRFGNKIEYLYDENIGENVNDLSSIKWSIYELKLVYENRPDSLTSYFFGDKKELKKRLVRLELLINGSIARYYKLDYKSVGRNLFSRINKISLCDANNSCTRGTTFSWKTRTLGTEKEFTLNSGVDFSTFALADLNQDGQTDVCYLNAGISNGNQGGLFCAQNNTALTNQVNDSQQSISTISLGSFYQVGSYSASVNHPKSANSLTFIDLNNDTYPDYCIQREGDIQCGLNVGDPRKIGFNTNTAWTTEFNYEQNIQFIDLNGDKQPDICDIGTDSVQCAYNKGDGFTQKSPILASGWPTKQDQKIPNSTVSFIDVDGNGIIDICGAKDGGYFCAINEGNRQNPKFTGQINYPAPPSLGINWKGPRIASSFRYGDLNSDGLIDMCWLAGELLKCSINSGKGFGSETAWAKNILMASWNATDAGKTTDQAYMDLAFSTFMLNDIDSDGRADLCVASPAYKFSCALNTGSAFAALQDYSSLHYNDNSFQLDGMPTSSQPRALPLRFADMNADGYADICYRGHNGITCGLATPPEMGLLLSVTSDYGNTTKINYGFLSDPGLYQHEGIIPLNATEKRQPIPLIDIEPNIRIVKSISSSNGIGGENTILYHYSGLKFDKEKGIRSFHQISQKNIATQQETETEYHQSEDLNGKIAAVHSILNGVVTQSSYSSWSVSKSSTGIKLILPTSSTDKYYDYASKILLKEQSTLYEAYDHYGNAQKIITETKNASGNEWSRKTTESTYWNDAGSWLLSKPKEVTVTHESSQEEYKSIIRKTAFTYNLSNGSLETEKIEPNTELELFSAFEYDAFGNKVKTTITGFNGIAKESRTSSVNYDDAYGIQLLSKTNSLNQTETFDNYDATCNKPTQYHDVNLKQTRWEYDSLCQTTKEIRPDNTSNSWKRSRSSGYPVIPGENDHSIYQVTETATGSPPKTVWYDGLGREVRSQTTGFDGKNILQDKVYDAIGRLEKSTLPYVEGQYPGDYSRWVTTQYDELGRIKSLSQPGDTDNNHAVTYTTRYEYNGLSTTIIDSKNNSKTTTNNVLDKPVEIKEGDASKEQENSSIVYTYDAIGNLRTSNTNGQIISMSYDARGNKVSLNDPVMGNWQYRFNAFGELVWQMDAKSQKTIQTHDQLGRLITRKTTDDTARWVYDTAPNAVGKLASEKSNNASTAYNYDELGRPISTVKVIAGQTFNSKVSYDQYSRPVRETYPDGFAVLRKYNNNGYLQSLSTPNANVWDYDYQQLEETLIELGKAVVQARETAESYQADYQASQKEALLLYEMANTYENKSASAAQDASTLKILAQQLQLAADSYQRTAEQYHALADTYGDRYNDFIFTAISSSRGYTAFSLNPDGIVLSNWQVNLPIIFNVNETINLRDFYNATAQQFESLAVTKTRSAITTSLVASVAQINTVDYAQMAKTYEEKAAIQQTQVQTNAAKLKAVQDRIADYEASIAALQKILDTEDTATTKVLWTATSQDAAGRVDGEIAGNGLLTQRVYDLNSGHLRRITTGLPDNLDFTRNLIYGYDGANNVERVTDMVEQQTKVYRYDSLGRLSNEAVSGPDKITQQITLQDFAYQYDLSGNITEKPKVGSMAYDPANPTQLQHLTRTDGVEKNYTYDANGNMVQAGDNRVTWTTFNQPLSITNRKTGTTANFTYDASQQRVQQMTGMVGKSETTTYVSSAFEVMYNDVGVNDRITQYKHHIYAGNVEVATHVRTLKGNVKQPDEFRYLHHDALGSVDTITDSHGDVIQRMSYDPFGTRKVIASNDPDLKAWTARGFTGHEHLDGLGLIHMNARLYDPEIGRFLSPDTYIQLPGSSQNYNRYAYVMNNPLKYTDPSGHFLDELLDTISDIGSFIMDNLPAIAAVATAILFPASGAMW